ncbi:MAG: hypothetical protein RLZZ234_846 [Candidatus Parcubacteria bacterium]|jgi:peptidoglycan hydrolase-like protein with peptidoglycan-binding domain
MLPISVHAAPSITELFASLKVLTAELETLKYKGELSQLQHSNTCPSFTRNVARGSEGDDVYALQSFLVREKLLSTDSVTGYFGSQTEKAVQIWQKKHKVVPHGTPESTGYGAVGPRTQEKLARVCKLSVHEITSKPKQQTGGASGGGSTSQTAPISTTPPPYVLTRATLGATSTPTMRTCTLNNSVSVPHGGSVTAYKNESVPNSSVCQSEIRTCTDGTLSGTFTHSSCSVLKKQPKKISSSYFIASTVYGDFTSEATGALNAGHVDAAHLASAVDAKISPIVDVMWDLFSKTGANGTFKMRDDIDQSIQRLKTSISPHLSDIAAFYVIDEPYTDAKQVPKTVLETVISKLEAAIPGIPTYITFAHHCFQPGYVESRACTKVPSSERGVPSNLDWVSFDWYNGANDQYTKEGVDAHFKERIVKGVTKLKSLTSAKIILAVEAFDKNAISEQQLMEVLFHYFSLARSDSRIYGLDFFIWADVPNLFDGVHSLSIRPTVRALSQSLLHFAGVSEPKYIPVFEWYNSTVPDHDYSPWERKGWETSGYLPKGVAFALPRVGTPYTKTLYRCKVVRATATEYFLTTSATCNDVPLVKEKPSVVGAIYPAPCTSGKVALYRFGQQKSPWDAAYSVDPNYLSSSNYKKSYSLGCVIHPDSL